MSDCGGCQGLGAHRRWCPEAVGPAAAQLGRYSEEAGSLGDRVGPNDMLAANLLWRAERVLRESANERAAAWQERRDSPTA